MKLHLISHCTVELLLYPIDSPKFPFIESYGLLSVKTSFYPILCHYAIRADSVRLFDTDNTLFVVPTTLVDASDNVDEDVNGACLVAI